MPQKLILESELGAFAKQCRLKSGKTKIETASMLGVARTSVQLAEENPEQHLNRLRIRIIENCSEYAVEGPIYRLLSRPSE